MKKLIGLTLILAAVLLCFTLSVTASPSATHTSDEGRLPFEDVKSSHWFCDSLEFCYANGIIKGMNDYTFGFSGNLTRAQFVTMLAGLEGVDTSTYTVTKFTDVKSSHWYYGAVAWAYTEGIVNGMTETTFAPNASLTRAQLATIMRSYMEGEYEVEIRDDALDTFTDKPKESYWYYDAMKYTVSAGLLSGNSDGTLAATGTVTRAQAVVILKSFMEKYFYGSCEHLFSEADCTNSAVCEKCGLVNGLPKGHRIVAYNCTVTDVCLDCGAEVAPSMRAHAFVAATCTAPRTCYNCGVTRGEAKGHSWKAATCTAPKTCTVCKATEGTTLSANGQHSWWLATCTNPKMCKICYKTEDKALGHIWKAADCVNPRSCTRWGCKATEGSALSSNGQHTWWSATCTNPKMCKVCYKTEGKALGHTTVNGFCSRCKKDNFASEYRRAAYYMVKKATPDGKGGYIISSEPFNDFNLYELSSSLCYDANKDIFVATFTHSNLLGNYDKNVITATFTENSEVVNIYAFSLGLDGNILGEATGAFKATLVTMPNMDTMVKWYKKTGPVHFMEFLDIRSVSVVRSTQSKLKEIGCDLDAFGFDLNYWS